MIDLENEFLRFEIKPRGVIHIGAHEASEFETYNRLGFTKFLFVEANSQLARKLQDRFKSNPSVTVAHAAITDYNGSVNLKITNFDQASSILPLAICKEIYPSIQQVAEESVPARTLDHLILELNLDPSHFNFLALDIQGAELMALRGSTSTLHHIASVQTEINLQELYEGSALLAEIDKFMAEQGFGRSRIEMPHHPTWGDAFYVRRSVVAMSSLGLNGRFGNQLFQYLYLWSVAKAQDSLIHTPQWIGKDLFDFKDVTPVMSLPLVKEKINNENSSISESLAIADERFFQKLSNFTSMDLWGNFQLHTSNYAVRKESIQNLFTIAPQWRSRFEEIDEWARSNRKRIIAIHLRRGDYGYECFYRAPAAWYEKWISEAGFSPDDHKIWISSESPELYASRFLGYEKLTCEKINLNDISRVILDFYMMVSADVLAISNSSFSFFAAMLNRKANCFMRPNVNLNCLVPFDPWDSNVFDRHYLSVEMHDLLNEQD